MAIRVRAYNVGFGDCLLVSIPDGAATRHMLIDFGNAPGKGGSNERFNRIAQNIQAETNGRLDAIVMTHEHLDHMEGFHSERAIFDSMTVGNVWMSLPSRPSYYTDYPNAEPLKKLKAAAVAYAKALDANPRLALSPSFESLLRNNLSNEDRIDYVRNLAKKAPKYLSRGSAATIGASQNVKFRVLAPEKDMSVYYGGSAHQIATMAAALSSANGGDGRWSFPLAQRVGAPLNLNASDWMDLRHAIQTGGVDAIRNIDKAQNNTSLVFVLEAEGKRLLFSGDAELESWEMMEEKAKKHLKAVDFLKVSHHGSHNGTRLELLDALLPKARKAQAQVLVSTKSKIYGTAHPVPDEALLIELGTRCRKVHSTDGVTEDWIDVTI